MLNITDTVLYFQIFNDRILNTINIKKAWPMYLMLQLGLGIEASQAQDKPNLYEAIGFRLIKNK